MNRGSSRRDTDETTTYIYIGSMSAVVIICCVFCVCAGVGAVAECLAKSHSDDTQEAAQVLLETLARGNPQYQPQVYDCLVALMVSSSPKAQQRVVHTLRTVQVENNRKLLLSLYRIKRD